jgi:hypothetical protein
MRSPVRVVRPRSSLLVAAVLVLAAGLLAGCGDSEIALPAPKESNERPDGSGSGDSDSGSDPDSEYCQAVADLEATDPEELADPALAVEALAALGDVAPDELKEPFDVLAGVVEEMGALDPDDPDYIEQSLEIIMTPGVQDAADAIDEYTAEACGIDLEGDDTSTDDTAVDDPTGSDSGSASGDIDLEDVDAVKEASTSTWADKLTSTSILNDTDVTLSAESSDPVTADEALEACTEVRAALVRINPQVTLEIRNGETTVAAAPAGGSCAAA